MKIFQNKDLLVRVAAVLAVLVAGIFALQKVHSARVLPGKPDAAAPARPAIPREVKGKVTELPEKRPATPMRGAPGPRIPEGKGALTVKLQDSSGVPVRYRMGLYKEMDDKASLYVIDIVAGRPQVAAPGKYDIVLMGTPRMVYKDISVKSGEETSVDLGVLTGAVTVKMADSKGNPARYNMKIENAEMPGVPMGGSTNRKIELVPGIYRISILTKPAQERKDVRVVAGREEVVDMGSVMGSLSVKAVGADGKPIRFNVGIKEAGSDKILFTIDTARPVDIVHGTYDLEVFAKPPQSKKGVVIKPGEETVITIQQ